MINREKRILWVAFSRRAGRIGGFGANGRDGLQQEVAEFGEGGGFLAGDAALREEAKDLAEGPVHANGGGEITAGGIEFGKIEGAADDGAPSGAGCAKQLLFAFGVVVAERRMNVGAGHGALAAVGEHELATLGLGLGFRRKVESVVVTVGVRLGSEACRRNMVGGCGESGSSGRRWHIFNLRLESVGVDVGLVRREIGAVQFGRILDRKRGRISAVAVG